MKALVTSVLSSRYLIDPAYDKKIMRHVKSKKKQKKQSGEIKQASELDSDMRQMLELSNKEFKLLLLIG